MDTARSLPSTIRKVISTADEHGVTIPAKARKQVVDALDLVEKIEDLDLGSRASVNGTIFDALKAGRDPLTDTDVRDAVLQREIAALVANGNVTETARENLHDVTVENIETIFAAFKPAFDGHGEALAQAHTTMTSRGIPNLDSPSILTAGQAVGDANIAARDAIRSIRQIDQALSIMLVGTIGLNNAAIGRHVRIFDVGNATPADVMRVANHGTIDYWDGLTAGYTISLAGPAETQARVDRGNDADDRRTQQNTANVTALLRRDMK